MSNIDYHRSLFEIISPLNATIVDTSFIEVDYSENRKKKCERIGIKTETIQNNKLRLLTDSLSFKIFQDIDHFLYKARDIQNGSDFLILDYERPISFIKNKTYVNFELHQNYFLVSNTKSYLEFIDFLKEQEKETDEAFHFVDSFNKDLRKISFVSLSDKGRLNITYDLKVPFFNPNEDFSIGLNKFKSCFNEENKTLPKFLKAETINYAAKLSNKTRLKELFENLDDVVEKAHVNFEVYLNNLSIDKVKKDYDEVKSKYFNDLSEILSKLTNKIILLPIGISALLFAINKVKDNDIFLLLIILSILVTSAYISTLLKVHFKDLQYINRIFKNDYKILIDNNFFTKYPEEKSIFEEIKTRVTDRIKLLKIFIESYYWVMNLANVSIIAIGLYFIELQIYIIAFIVILILFFLIVIRNSIIKANPDNSIPE